MLLGCDLPHICSVRIRYSSSLAIPRDHAEGNMPNPVHRLPQSPPGHQQPACLNSSSRPPLPADPHSIPSFPGKRNPKMHSFPVPMCHSYQHCSFIMCDDDNILWNSYTGEERPNSRVNLLKTIPVTCLCVTSNITLILYPFLRCHGVDIPSPWAQSDYIIMNRLELLLFLVFGFAYSWFNNWLFLCWLFFPWRNVYLSTYW